MSLLVLLFAIVATIVCIELIRRGAIPGQWAWVGYLVLLVIWLLVLLNLLGYGSGLNVRIGMSHLSIGRVG